MPINQPAPTPTRSPRSDRRRYVALAGTAALVVAGLAASATSATAESDDELRRALLAAPDTIQTPFENNNGTAWTTVEESQRFWKDLDQATDKVRVDQIGTTTQGRPLQLVQVGAPAPKSLREAAEGSVLMYNCSIHGDENSGREACMQLARDMAFANDPSVDRLLKATTVLFLNSNPDGWAADTRQNADGFDINRDFMNVETLEGAAIVETIRDWKPDVLNDLHEYGSGEFYNTDLLHLWPRNRNVDASVYRLAKQMNLAYSAPLVESLGYSSGIYGIFVKDGEPFRQVAGDGQARILRNYSGLQHVAGMLSETAGDALTPEEEADPSLLNRRRVEVNYTSAVGSAEFMTENWRRLDRQTTLAAQRAIQKGADQSGVVYFEGQDNVLPMTGSGVEPNPMCAYQLNAEQFGALESTMVLQGISWEPSADGGALVTMAQEDSPLIPLLFDERSEYRLTEATPINEC